MSNRTQITLDYEESTGSIYDAQGTIVGTWHGLQGVKGGTKIDDLMKLKQAGFTADEIVKLKKGELI